jgi:hypothetical protein
MVKTQMGWVRTHDQPNLALKARKFEREQKDNRLRTRYGVYRFRIPPPPLKIEVSSEQ